MRTARHALDRLREGNQRFATVPAELVFDQGFGDLFVIRDGLLVVGAEYSLETGVVEFFDDAG